MLKAGHTVALHLGFEPWTHENNSQCAARLCTRVVHFAQVFRFKYMVKAYEWLGANVGHCRFLDEPLTERPAHEESTGKRDAFFEQEMWTTFHGFPTDKIPQFGYDLPSRPHHSLHSKHPHRQGQSLLPP